MKAKCINNINIDLIIDKIYNVSDSDENNLAIMIINNKNEKIWYYGYKFIIIEED